METSVQLHAFTALILGRDTSIHWLEGWVDPRAGLDAMAKTHTQKPSLPLQENEHWLPASRLVTILNYPQQY